jgi:hypothetical protein
MNDDRIGDYLDHMLEAALQACAYVEGLAKKDDKPCHDFDADFVHQKCL